MGLMQRWFAGDDSTSHDKGQHRLAWHSLEDSSGLEAAIQRSHDHPVLLFKHSTRCSISAMALDRLQRGWDIPEEFVQPWLLDLIQHRDISNAIAERLGVMHQSPQAILLRDGRVVWHASHSAISMAAVKQAMAAAA
jgi:bacillithiol system protein YtxJ